jgi:hypothetical protein
MLLRVALVRTDVSEELISSIFRVKIISDTFLRKIGSYKNHTANIAEDDILQNHRRENFKPCRIYPDVTWRKASL